MCFQWRSKWLAIFVVFLLFIIGKSHCSRWYPVTIILACLAFLQRVFLFKYSSTMQSIVESTMRPNMVIMHRTLVSWTKILPKSRSIAPFKAKYSYNHCQMIYMWLNLKVLYVPTGKYINSRLVDWMLSIDLKSIHSGKVLETLLRLKEENDVPSLLHFVCCSIIVSHCNSRDF
jgi:hypothetical protein